MSTTKVYLTADEAVLATFERLWAKQDQDVDLSEDFAKEYLEAITPFVSHGSATSRPLQWHAHLASDAGRSLRILHPQEVTSASFLANTGAGKGTMTLFVLTRDVMLTL